MKRIGTAAGIVAAGYDDTESSQQSWNRRLLQFAIVHLFSGSAALTTCPAAMTDGAAVILSKHLNDADGDQPGRARVMAAYRQRLISFDPDFAWTSGQWMTERIGGSDVSMTESVATRLDAQQISDDEKAFGSDQDVLGLDLGPWCIDGFKWFSSATDADMVILLARTAKGISTFLAPMRRKMHGGGSVMNGVRIVRLKDKMGTKQLPTAELEIKGMRAWLIGEEGKGVKSISAILNSTRLWTAIGAVGGFARGLAIARAYSRVRKVKNALLQDNAQHVAWMATETVRYWAACHLVFFGAALQGISEQGEDASKATTAVRILPTTRLEAEILLRVLTPVMKAQCSLASVNGLRACMESLGGVGYCENNQDGGVMNIARIFRDTNVNCIWEGTTSVMAEDIARALKGRQGEDSLKALDGLVERMLKLCSDQFPEESRSTQFAWTQCRGIIQGHDIHELHYRGRELLRMVEKTICSCLLMYNAIVTGNTVAKHVARRWALDTMSGDSKGSTMSWKQAAAIDRQIFIGAPADAPHIQSRL